jgi:hypothetical protein
VTPLEDQMYVALMAAKSFIQPRVRADLRDMGVLNVIEQTIKLYQDKKSPPPGKVNRPMDWDAVKEIQPDG